MSSKSERLEAAGRWLRRTREAHGYAKASDFARDLGVDPSLISRYELGATEVSTERAQQIAQLFELDELYVRQNLRLWVPKGNASVPSELDDPVLSEIIQELRNDPGKARAVWELLVRRARKVDPDQSHDRQDIGEEGIDNTDTA